MSKPPPHVFIDTNVWFSAFYGSPNAEKVVRAHIESNIQAVISKQVLEELISIISRKIPEAITPLKKLLKTTPPIIVKDPQKISALVHNNVDPKDQAIFQAAIEAKVTYFITGNTKHFSISKIKAHTDITILTPKQAVYEFNLENN